MSLGIPCISNAECETRDGVVRQHVRGTRTVVARAALPCGVFETCLAQPGPYHTRYDVFALVMSDLESVGPVACNGAVVSRPCDQARSFSVLSPGDVIWGRFSKTAHYDILYLDPWWLRSALAAEFEDSVSGLTSHVRFSPSATLLALWRRIRGCVCTNDAVAADIVDHFVRLLVIHLAECNAAEPAWAPQSCSRDQTHGGNRAVKDAIRFIDANLATKLTLQMIASRACLSPFHFCRVFRCETGLSVRQFILERRLLNAQRLLTGSHDPICAIAHQCGFSSQSHLTSAFKARFGTTPSVFRRDGLGRAS